MRSSNDRQALGSPLAAEAIMETTPLSPSTSAGSVPRRDPNSDPDWRGIGQLDSDLLRRRWRSAFGRPAPKTLSRSLLIRILIWREQIAETGDISPRTRAALEAALRPAAATSADAARPRKSLRLGTVLVREHRGALHQVTALDRGYEWNGRAFPSLSAVAQAISGTKWNGRRFFGLDQKAPKKLTAALKADSRSEGAAP